MKTFLFSLALLIGVGANAQYLDVTDIFFTAKGQSFNNPLPDTDLNPGDTVTLWFVFTNNLGGGQDLKKGDSLTFGWSIGGQNQGNLIMSSLGNNLANGSTLNAYLRNNYVLPNVPGQQFEICTWPLYNPYAANTDPTKGKHCTTFSIKKNNTSVQLVNSDNQSNFYLVNRSLNYNFNSEDNTIEIYDLTGHLVQTNQVGYSGAIELNNEINSGVYIVKAANSISDVVLKIYVQ